jgi:indolepyruvate ferredoxin oxidoreductase alpha subunit
MPFVEEKLRGILAPRLPISGKFDGTLPRAGELDPDKVRAALGLPPRPVLAADVPALPGRPPQLCQGCPHADSYETIKRATADLDSVAVTSDIGCYALGALPPYGVPETIVCMGASVNMAKGAADAGIKHTIGVIGDSTFLHSGITPLIDAIAADTPMTLVILDNSIVAMTGCQDTMLGSARLPQVILGLGVDPDHLLELEAKKPLLEANVAALRKEIEYRGLSVVIFRRECLEAFKKRKKAEAAKARGVAACEDQDGGRP